MKKLFALMVGLMPVIVFQLITSCADPLQPDQLNPTVPTNPRTDTIVIIDTTVILDSVFIIDSTIIIDTLIYLDSGVVVPSNDSIRHCSRLGSGQHEIVWLLQNEAGDYHLQFAALAERGKPKQTAVVYIGSHRYEWNPADQWQLVIDQYLEANTIIRIELSEPTAYGHALDICLLMSKAQ